MRDEDWKCPDHNLLVVRRTRFGVDDINGVRKFGGEYFACPRWIECKWDISPRDLTVRVRPGDE